MKTDCKCEWATAKFTSQQNYAVRFRGGRFHSIVLDSEQDRCEGARCSRCGRRVFFSPGSSFPEIEVPTFKKALADFVRELEEIVDADAFASSGDEEDWQG